jgi:hypothetical protein
LTRLQVLGLVLEQISSAVYAEDDFIAEFLQINDAALTFADYMGLDNYFRRQASRSSGMGQTTMKLVRGAMDLIFGFLPAEMKEWIDNALSKDPMYTAILSMPIHFHLTNSKAGFWHHCFH